MDYIGHMDEDEDEDEDEGAGAGEDEGEGEGEKNVDHDSADEKLKELPQVSTSTPNNRKNEEKADLQAPLLAE